MSSLASYELLRISANSGAGSGTWNTDGFGIEGSKSVTMAIQFGADAVGSVALELFESDDDVSYTIIDAATVGPFQCEADGIILLRVLEPRKKYMRLTITRLSSMTIDSVLAVFDAAQTSPAPVTALFDIVQHAPQD